MDSSLKPAGNLHNDPSAPGENEYPSGFPQSICDDVPQQKYLCSNCNNVLNEARQTLCGHRYCLACVSWLVSNNNNLVCKMCKEEDPSSESETSILTSDNLFSDAAINKEILELKVHCANQGCSWRSILKDFEEHQGQCEYALIPCNIGCGHMVLRKALACHLEKACPNNMSVCPACCHSMRPIELQTHSCNSLGEEKTDKKQRKGKSNTLPGSKEKEYCVFSEVGCTFKGTTEKLRVHENSSHVGHLQLLLRAATTTSSDLQATPLTAPAQGKENRAMDEQLPHLRDTLSGLRLHWDMGLSKGEGELETEGGDGRNSSAAHSLRDDDQVTILLDLGRQIDTLQQRVQISENIISVLNREVEKTQLSMKAVERENQSNQEMIYHLEIKVTEQEHRMARKDLVISSMKQSLSAHQEVSYDGTFIWRLSDLSTKMKEAVSSHGNRPNLYSPAFYTARYGFKVCMRLYLNGDGVGKGTHISLFFVIMKGEYDLLLSWPFKHKVTFFLLDQNHREHVIDAFRPDLTSSSFQRPVSDMNVASGCPLFFPLGKLHSPKHAYLKDDTIFIKCVVDTSS
ncbi:TNF receptor-associated factor 1 [Salvelinus namaycush]|uniref:TNF receptor-associated factor n=1 Tax=Salvelinus namaycush TaxID=8040 RepID=A0A8U0QYV2_SALNM|nr:TNF receptor-associated factor 1 [Salvelinus namaycush]